MMVYIAGPFSAKTRDGVDLNIRRAVDLGLSVAAAGAFPVIPHSNTAHPDFEKLQSPMNERFVTVCAACLCVSCWHYTFPCDRYLTANVRRMAVSELDKLGREHPSYYSEERLIEVTGAVDG